MVPWTYGLTRCVDPSSDGGMSSLEDLEKKQADTAKYAKKMLDEKDPQALLEMAAKMAEKSGELLKMAKSIEATLAPKENQGPEVRVVLTPDQKARVAEATGVGVEVVVLHDTAKKPWSKEMPKIGPEVIERLAAQQAAESKLVSETRKEVEKVIKKLKSLNVPEIADAIAELERDPTLVRGKKTPK